MLGLACDNHVFSLFSMYTEVLVYSLPHLLCELDLTLNKSRSLMKITQYRLDMLPHFFPITLIN